LELFHYYIVQFLRSHYIYFIIINFSFDQIPNYLEVVIVNNFSGGTITSELNFKLYWSNGYTSYVSFEVGQMMSKLLPFDLCLISLCHPVHRIFLLVNITIRTSLRKGG